MNSICLFGVKFQNHVDLFNLSEANCPRPRRNYKGRNTLGPGYSRNRGNFDWLANSN
jgi:hypothetical protein